MLRSKVDEYLFSRRSSLLSTAVSGAGHAVQVVTVVARGGLRELAGIQSASGPPVPHAFGMSDFDIRTYAPDWSCGRATIAARHGSRLRALIGRPLTRAWLLWDVPNDTWFADAPVLLDFGGERVEIQHQKFDGLALTWNSLNPHGCAHWPGFDLRWRHDADSVLAALQGQELHEIELLKHDDDDMAKAMVALGFVFPGGRVTVYNALDTNGLSYGAPSSAYERHAL